MVVPTYYGEVTKSRSLLGSPSTTRLSDPQIEESLINISEKIKNELRTYDSSDPFIQTVNDIAEYYATCDLRHFSNLSNIELDAFCRGWQEKFITLQNSDPGVLSNTTSENFPTIQSIKNVDDDSKTSVSEILKRKPYEHYY